MEIALILFGHGYKVKKGEKNMRKTVQMPECRSRNILQIFKDLENKSKALSRSSLIIRKHTKKELVSYLCNEYSPSCNVNSEHVATSWLVSDGK